VDDETRTALQRLAGDEAGIPAQLHGRLRGESIKELREDARAFALDAGFAEPPEAQPRNERGQFQRPNQRVNDAVRAAFGYPTSTEQSEPPVAGDIGVGRGGGALPRESRQPVSMNDLIRGTANAPRDAAHMFAEQLASERVRGG
jgi:hypothetical protein